MGLLVGLLYLFKGCMGIDLCCREAGVPQQGLDGTDIRTVVEHRGGKGVSEHVRGVLLQGGHLAHTPAYHLIESRCLHRGYRAIALDGG